MRKTIALAEYDPLWPEVFGREAEKISAALGERAVRVEHAGSTSVPGLIAKPVIDIVLEVADSAAESGFAGDLERAGYRFQLREPGWFEHRLFRGSDPDVNLHVFTAGCAEVARMLRFRDWLRGHPEDRELYAGVKRALAGREWGSVQDYADAKTETVREIMIRADAGFA